MYSAEDAEWEEKLRQELQKKKGGKEAEQLDPEQKAREEYLKKEQPIREQVAKIVESAVLQLKVIYI